MLINLFARSQKTRICERACEMATEEKHKHLTKKLNFFILLFFLLSMTSSLLPEMKNKTNTQPLAADQR